MTEVARLHDHLNTFLDGALPVTIGRKKSTPKDLFPRGGHQCLDYHSGYEVLNAEGLARTVK